MKRSKLCYGVLSALAIIFGWSLNVSSDTSAFKYSYTSFPLGSSHFGFIRDSDDFNFSVGSNGLSFTFYSADHSSFSAAPGRFTPSSLSNGSCNPLSERDILNLSNITSPSLRYRILANDYFSRYYYVDLPLSSDYSLFSNDFCFLNSFDYDSIFASTVNTSTGDFDKYVEFGQLFTSDNHALLHGSIYSAVVPLSINYDNVGNIPSGTPLSFTFEMFSGAPLTDLSPHSTATLYLGYLPNPQTWTSSHPDYINAYTGTSVSCNVTPNHEFLITNDDLTFTHNYGYLVNCDFTAPADMSYVLARLEINSNGTLPVFSYDEYLYFGSSYLITNNDDTWSGLSANLTPAGDNISSAPGYSQLYGDVTTCSAGDFFCNLSDLFNFNFVNPFEPIFHLFSDSSHCASIPTIAGMIHSNETTVCPWFPTSVRNIATPVLGLASMMLIFGFAVRWLGSSSGNLFEDSRHEEVSNQGGRWGHFTKGGR